MPVTTDRSRRIALAVLYLTLFVLPWQTHWLVGEHTLANLPWEYGQLKLYAAQLLAAVLLVLTALSQPDWKLVRRWWPAGLLVIWALLSAAWSYSGPVATYHATLTLSAAAIGVCLTTLHPPLYRIASVLSVAGLLQGLVAISQFLHQAVGASSFLGLAAHRAAFGSSVVQTAAGELFMRAYGSLPHPNLLGGWLAVCWLASLALRLRTPTTARLSYRLALSFGLAVTLVGLVLSFSRGAWLAAALGTLYLLGLEVKRTSWRRAAGVAGLLVVATALMLWPLRGVVSGRVSGTSDIYLERFSIGQRQATLSDGIQLWQAHPVVGVGAGNSTAAAYRALGYGGPTSLVQPPHLTPLAVAAELGVVGLALAVLLAAGLWPRRTEAWTVALLAVPLVTGLFDHYWWTLWPGLALGAVVLALQRLEPGPS